MPVSPSKSTARRLAVAAAIGAGALAAVPAGASAAGTNACDASALQLSLLGGAAIDPIHANPGYTPCVSADGTLVSVPPLLGLDAVVARTRTAPTSNVVSEATVAGVEVGVDGPIVDALTGPLLNGPNSIVGQVDGLVGGLLGAGTPLRDVLDPVLGGLPLLGGLTLGTLDSGAVVSGVTGNLSGALVDALPDVLDAGVIAAQARAICSNGQGQLSGASNIADLSVLGTSVDANSAASRVLSLDTAQLNLGQLLTVDDVLRSIQVDAEGPLGIVLAAAIGTTNTNLYDLLYTTDASVLGAVNGLLAGLGIGTVGDLVSQITATLQPVLNEVNVNLPAGLLRAQVVPHSQTIVGDQLTQQALTLSVTALGQPILAGTVAQARVGAGAPGCVPTATPPVPPADDNKGIQNPERFSSPEAEVFLQCSRRPADLIDVYGQGGRTFVQGVTERKYVGKTATIYLKHGKKKVGTVKIGEDGLFSRRVALPPKSIRNTNKARYYAVVEGKRTRALKFARRMTTNSLTATTETVTFRGRVLGPLQKRQKSVTIKQRVGCKSYKTVATVRPDSKGRFTAKIDAPKGESAVIYRAQTRVGFRRNASRLAPTFTLPRVVGLR
jgi:hypothetical protein